MDVRIEQTHPLLPSQRGFLVDSLAGEAAEYRQQIHIKILRKMSSAELVSNIRASIKSHKILRTIFDWEEGEPAQVVISGLDPVINVISSNNDMEILLSKERESLLPIDSAPPIRFVVIEGPVMELIITYSHIILDGTSVELMIDEVITGDVQEQTDSSTYQTWYRNNVGSKEEELWPNLLKSLSKQSGNLEINDELEVAESISAQLGTIFQKRLIESSKRSASTPAVYMQTLWNLWSTQYFEKNNLLYGLVVSTRLQGLTEFTLGPYITTIPWISDVTAKSFYDAVSTTDGILKSINTAKHLPLGEIAKLTSSSVFNMDSILTINTNPVGSSKNYKVLHTHENTGYKLSVDIDITKTITIKFTGTMRGASAALASFREYCDNQMQSDKLVNVTKNHQTQRVFIVDDRETEVIDKEVLGKAIAQSLSLRESEVNLHSSFLDNGGDSIAALRLRSLLKTQNIEVSIADILQVSNIGELERGVAKHKIVTPTPSPQEINKAVEMFGSEYDNIIPIPPAAMDIVFAHRNGYGQDYHEQTGFRLISHFDREIFDDALLQLVKEFPTLKLHYPAELPDFQILTKRHRVSVEERETVDLNFDAFIDEVSSEFWNRPLEIEKDPLVRIVIGRKSDKEWFFFMSFSALVTDGWSFSTLLLRLFETYEQIKSNLLVEKPEENYLMYSRSQSSEKNKSLTFNSSAQKSYKSTVSALDFEIDSISTNAIIEYADSNHITLNNAISTLLAESLPATYSELVVYTDSRDDSLIMDMVGPFSRLVPMPILGRASGEKAYFVYENYPRERENKLRSNYFEIFNEQGNWRRDLLPPGINIGFLFDLVEGILNVKILTRDDSGVDGRHSEYWSKLVETINETLLNERYSK